MKYMQYKFLKAGHVLFNKGELGNSYYVILMGEIEIWIQTDKVIEQSTSPQKKIVRRIDSERKVVERKLSKRKFSHDTSFEEIGYNEFTKNLKMELQLKEGDT